MGLFDKNLDPNDNSYPWAKTLTEAIWQTPWNPSEFSFKSDRDQFLSEITDNERQVITRALSAVAQVEVCVKQFWGNLGQYFPHSQIITMGYTFAHTEGIHQEAYKRLLDVLSMNDVFKQNMTIEGPLKERVNYLLKHLEQKYEDPQKQYIYSLIIFTLFIENVSLFSQFYIMRYFYRFENKFKDVAKQIAYTRTEETLHAHAGISLINTIKLEYPDLIDKEMIEEVYCVCEDALYEEGNVIDWILEGFVENEKLSKDLLNIFIADRLYTSLENIGFAENVKAAFDRTHYNWFNEELIGSTKVDFFHGKSINYAKNNRDYDNEDIGF